MPGHQVNRNWYRIKHKSECNAGKAFWSNSVSATNVSANSVSVCVTVFREEE